MNTTLLEIIKCPECRGTVSAFDEAGRECEATAFSNGARVLTCKGCGRWFPVLDEIPRLLPDPLRDAHADDEFLAHNEKVFARLGLPRLRYATKSANELYGQFQRQRLLWGEQDRWEDLYLLPVPYSAPDRKHRKHDAKEGLLKFFSMNLHCDYGQTPRKDQIVAQVAAAGNQLTLDIGCGAAGNRTPLQERGNRYVGLDVQAFSGPDVQATAASLPFADVTFDFVICDSVLEHVPDPWSVCNEIYRVLKPGGQALFVVPFIFKNHGAPFDFYRYTKSGLHTLLRPYAKVKIFSFGGFFHVVGHLIEAMYTHIPFGIGRVLKAIHNCIFYVLNKLDRFDRYRIFSRGYYALVQK